MKILVEPKKGNYSSGVEALCAFCENPFLKKGQNNKYCSKSCREKTYQKEGRQRSWSRRYLENNIEKRLVISARSRAKKRGVTCNITHEDISIPEFCPILGIELQLSTGNGGSKNSPSLDRIDNSLGYTKGNVQVISNLANTMKSYASKEELVTFAKWVIDNEDSL